MKLMTCPLNGERNISEFTYGGEVHSMPEHHDCSKETWAEYLFFHDNTAGVVREWWCHSASSYWFIAERNTISDEIIRTFPARELYQERVEFSKAKAGEAS